MRRGSVLLLSFAIGLAVASAAPRGGAAPDAEAGPYRQWRGTVKLEVVESGTQPPGDGQGWTHRATWTITWNLDSAPPKASAPDDLLTEAVAQGTATVAFERQDTGIPSSGDCNYTASVAGGGSFSFNDIAFLDKNDEATELYFSPEYTNPEKRSADIQLTTVDGCGFSSPRTVHEVAPTLIYIPAESPSDGMISRRFETVSSCDPFHFDRGDPPDTGCEKHPHKTWTRTVTVELRRQNSGGSAKPRRLRLALDRGSGSRLAPGRPWTTPGVRVYADYGYTPWTRVTTGPVKISCDVTMRKAGRTRRVPARGSWKNGLASCTHVAPKDARGSRIRVTMQISYLGATGKVGPWSLPY